MTDIDFTTLPREKALEVCHDVFGMDTDEANEFVDLARGTTTIKAYSPAQKRVPKGRKGGGQFARKIGGYGSAVAAGVIAGARGHIRSRIGQGVQAAVGKPGDFAKALHGDYKALGRFAASAAVGSAASYYADKKVGKLYDKVAGGKKFLRNKRDQRAAETIEKLTRRGTALSLTLYGNRRAIRAGAHVARAAWRGYQRSRRYRPVFNQLAIDAPKVINSTKYRFAQAMLDRVALKAHKTETEQVLATPMVFKEANGDYRWVLLSTNGYRDRDNQLLATKGLERDVALWELEGSPPDPLRWWHVALDEEHVKGVELGYTDFRMVYDHTLIESGKFLTKEIGEGVYNARDQLEASVGFRHSKAELDEDGVFHNIHIFERSLLPKGRASNVLTQLLVTE